MTSAKWQKTITSLFLELILPLIQPQSSDKADAPLNLGLRGQVPRSGKSECGGARPWHLLLDGGREGGLLCEAGDRIRLSLES